VKISSTFETIQTRRDLFFSKQLVEHKLCGLCTSMYVCLLYLISHSAYFNFSFISVFTQATILRGMRPCNVSLEKVQTKLF